MGASGNKDSYLASMGSVDSDMTTTTAQRFAAWLAPAMRAKGLNIDALRGGGRRQLAEAVGVSDSTVNRWLAGKVAPDPDNYEAIATALDTQDRDPAEATIEMLASIGIISSQVAAERRKSAVRLPPMTPTELADGAGIHDPVERQLFEVFLRGLTRAPHTSPGQDEDGGAATGAQRG